MAKKHPVEPLIDEISELLSQYDEHLDEKVEGELTPELFAMMADLEMRVSAAQEALRVTMKEEGLSEADLQNIARNKKHLPKKDVQVMERLGKLGNEVQTLHKEMKRVVDAEKATAAKTGKKVKKRRLGDSSTNLGIGFRKGWDKL